MTTYTAHIVTTNSPDLGDPEVIIMTGEDETTSGADPIISYPLDGSKSPEDVLATEGWRITSGPAEVDQGYYTLDVEALDPLAVIERVTLARAQAATEMDRRETAYRTVIRDAMHDGGSATKIARAAECSRERVYQIRDGRR